MCLLCMTPIAFTKKENVERLFKTLYSEINTKFPLKSDLRKQKVQQLKTQLSVCSMKCLLSLQRKAQPVFFFAFYHCASLLIAKKKQPFEEGEMIKEDFLKAGDLTCYFRK